MKQKKPQPKWTMETRKSLRIKMQRLKENIANVLFYENEYDAQLVDFVMLPIVSLGWLKENPLWCQIVGSSGSGKTAHISLLQDWEKAIFVSRLSKNSLISGYRNENDKDFDPSLCLMLDGKVLVVKDFTCILQSPKEERDSVIGQLRDVYDGQCARALGNIGFKEYKTKFSMLLATTNIIDGYHSVNTQLGERFIYRREHAKKRRAITTAAFDNVLHGTMHSKMNGICEEFREFVNLIPAVRIGEIEWPLEFKQQAIIGADFIAKCRSHVVRERCGRSIASRPSTEVGTRLVTQIAQAVAGFCVVNGKKSVDDVAWKFGGAQILRDTLPAATAWVLGKIYELTQFSASRGNSGKFTLKDMLPIVRLGYQTTEQIITDLYYHGILDAEYLGRTGRRSTVYRLTDKSRNIIDKINLFNNYDDEKIDIGSIPKYFHKRERKHVKEV